MAFRYSYTKYSNSPAASFWSFMQTMGPVTIGLAALFGAMGISLGFDLKPIWSVLTFIGCIVAAVAGIIYFLKLTQIMINRALNKAWNTTIQEAYDKETGKLPPEQVEMLKNAPHSYICFRCGTVSGYPYRYKGKCSKCKSRLFFTGASTFGWNNMSEEEKNRVISVMSRYRE